MMLLDAKVNAIGHQVFRISKCKCTCTYKPIKIMKSLRMKKNQRHMSDTSNCYYWCFHFEIHLLALQVHLRENKLTYRQQNE